MSTADQIPGTSEAANTRVAARLNPLLALCLAAATALLLACGGGSGPAAPATLVNAVIGAAGGTLTGPDGVQVVIPAGALNADTTIGIARSAVGAPAALADMPIAGSPYEFTPHDLVFNLPVTIRMPIPAGADASALFMANPGEDWQVIGATVTSGVAEWTRNSFSWGMVGLGCTATATLADLYPCSYPSGGANASATPAAAITRTAYGSLDLYSGNAGAWNITEAATVDMTLNYRAAADCVNARAKLIRWNPAVPVTAASPATVLFDQPVTLTPTVFSLPGGTFACSGATNLDGTACGSYRKGVGSTTVAVPFSHLDSSLNATGAHAFGYSFSCNRPGKPTHRGGDLMTFKVSIAVPSVTFNVGGSVAGLTGTGLVLASPGLTSLPISANGNFAFTSPVGAGTPYSVTVLTQPLGQTCTVANGSGTANANVTNVAVSCVAGSIAKAWQGAALLEAAAGDAFISQVIFDANGNGMAIWNQFDGSFYRIKSRRYTPGGGWGAVLAVDNGGPAMALNPKIAVDGTGNMMAVWLQPVGSGTTTSIWSNLYNPNSGWGTAALLENNLSSVGGTDPQIAMDAAGNATVVWIVFDGSWTNLWAKRFTAGGAWGVATQIENFTTGGSAAARVAMDAAGNAMVVWGQFDSVGARTDIWANRYAVGSGWGTPTLIETSNLSPVSVQIASDAAGNMVAVWEHIDPAASALAIPHSIYINRFSNGSWGTATLVRNGAPFAMQSKVAVGANGNAMLVWLEDDGSDTTSIWARAYTSSGVGGTPQRIDNLSAYTTGHLPQVAMDAAGNAVAVWGQGGHIWSARYVAGTGWSAAADIDSPGATASGNSPQIAVDANGNALAAWARAGAASQDIWSNVFK